MKRRSISLLWPLIAILCLLGLCLIFLLSAIRFSGYVLLGIAFFMTCCQLVRLLARKKPGIARVLGCILTVCICILVPVSLLTGGLILHAGSGSYETNCEYLIVLGAGINGTVPSLTLQYRLDAAYQYLTAHPDTVCILSGGQGPREDITEAECMFRYLTRRGISENRLLLEDKATSTRENLAFSREMIPDSQAAIGILSSEYHLFRARMMARDQGLAPILIPARTQMSHLRINYYLREIAGVWYYLIFGG